MSIFEEIVNGDLNSVIKYIETGGDINFTDDSGYSLLYLSAVMGKDDIVKLLKQNGAKSDFITEIAIGDLNKVKKYLEDGFDVNTINNQGHQGLMIAAHKGDIEIAKLLIKYNADINARHKISGNTALIAAIDQNQTNMVKFLIEIKVDVNVKNNAGITALQIALDKGNSDILELLKDAGAK